MLQYEKIATRLSMSDMIREISRLAAAEELITADQAVLILSDSLNLEELLVIAEEPRRRYYGNLVRIHILNNIQNGHCSEDCSYCAQRRDAVAADVVTYPLKPSEEILAEAKLAAESGAFRYCLVAAGKGPSESRIADYAEAIRKIKALYPKMEICLSAGILTNPDQAEILAEAGLDRYNHNLNTSMMHYDDICTTHKFSDRVDTLRTMGAAGVELCSGVIAGMGESDEDLYDVALRLREHKVASIPINFFLPIPGHRVEPERSMTPEYALRILILFRLLNPRAEIRMAAGREHHLRHLQPTALRVANSLFVSGYLNVHGSNTAETIAMIERSGFAIDREYSEPYEAAVESGSESVVAAESLRLKGERELRPFAKK